MNDRRFCPQRGWWDTVGGFVSAGAEIRLSAACAGR